jgi:hypothetical protein
MEDKICSKCEQTKPIDQFPVNRAKKGGRGGTCRECHSVYVRKHYADNVGYYVKKAKSNRIQCRTFVRQLKENSPCLDCGRLYPGEPWLKDFDHRPEETKSFNVASSHDLGIRAVSVEIAKCDVVCLICHRRRTAKRAGW